ncbi:MAG: hypothetical protein Q8P18_08050 [Pseudomonadota bacterium]|nr:hypothetical protein [Pseudomonadota bacterium]
MKKWLPYVVAAVLGIGVAVLAFGPGLGGGPSTATTAGDLPEKLEDGGRSVRTINNPGQGRTAEDVVADARANPLPPPGTLRPQNKAEIEHAARLARPFNQHHAYVGAFWNRAAQLVGKENPDLAKECGAMGRYLRDQGNLPDDSIDISGTIAKEKSLADKVRATAAGNTELIGILDYIEESGQAVLDGKDPTTVLKPSQKAAGQ